MSPTKNISAVASVMFVFWMAPATAGIEPGRGQVIAIDTPNPYVIDSKISVIASLTLGVVGSAVVVKLKKYSEPEYPKNNAVAQSDLEVFTLSQSFPVIQSLPVTQSLPVAKSFSATQKAILVSEHRVPSL